MTESHTDCRTPEGETVGLVDALIAIARTLARRHDLTTPAVCEALAYLRADEDVARLLAASTPRAPMQPSSFPEATQFLDRPPGMDAADCDAVSICHALVEMPSGEQAPTVITCWQPTDEERAALLAGAPVYLHVLGRSMPPVILSTQIEAAVVVGSN